VTVRDSIHGPTSGPDVERARDLEPRYHAFISYSHEADPLLAPALQRALQRFAKPWYRARALRIFRDEASLSANPALWPAIAAALDDSGHFILLASPQAAASPWVTREIRHWLGLDGAAETAGPGRAERLLVGLTAGELIWDEITNDYDWQRTTALSSDLRGTFTHEPRYIDLRWAHDEDELSLRHPHFRDAVAEFAAPLHDVPKDEIAGEEIRQHRRTVRVARAAVAVLAALTALALAASIVAVRQRDTARRERNVALSRLLAAEAQGAAPRWDRALLLGLEAYRAAATPDGRSAVLEALQRRGRLLGYLHYPPAHFDGLETVALSADGRRAVAAGDDGVVIWDVETGRRLATIRSGPVDQAGLAGDLVLTHGARTVTAWGLGDRSRHWSISGVRILAVSPGGRTFATAGAAGLCRWTTATRARSCAPLPAVLGPASALAVSADGQTLAAAGGRGSLVLWRNGPMRHVTGMPAVETVKDLTLSNTGLLGAVTEAGLRLYGAKGRPAGALMDTGRRPVKSVGVSPDGRWLVAGTRYGAAILWNLHGREPGRALLGHDPANGIVDVAFASLPLFATADASGAITLSRPDREALVRPLPGVNGDVNGISVTPDGRRLAISSGFGSRAVDDLTTGRRLCSDESEQQPPPPPGAPGRLPPAAPGPSHCAATAAVGRAPPAVGTRDGSVVVWDARHQHRLAHRRVANEAVTVTASRDGTTIAAQTAEAVRFLRLPSLAAIGPPHPCARNATMNLAFSADASTAAVVCDQGVLLWRRGERPVTLALPAGVNPVSAALRGGLLAVGGDGKTVLWDIQAGRQLGLPLKAPGRGGYVLVAYRPSTAELVTVSNTGAAAAWNVLPWLDDDALRTQACAVAGRNLTRGEWQTAVPGRAYHATCSRWASG
jgi:WD40 repeat protein